MRRVGLTYNEENKLKPYVEALRQAGLEPVPLIASAPYSLDGLDGLVVSGGTDLDPSLYGQQAVEESESADAERDAMELALTRAAIEADLPLLCICRGMQLLNVARGGDLVQHLVTPIQHRQRGVTDAHDVSTVAGTRLEEIVSATDFTVNSRHHQGVGRVGDGLVVSAVAPDGVIEAMEMPGRRFTVAVQWHPEDRVPSHAADTALFAAFARSV